MKSSLPIAAILFLGTGLAEAAFDKGAMLDTIQSAGMTNFEFQIPGTRPKIQAMLINPQALHSAAPQSASLMEAIANEDIPGVRAHLDQINIRSEDGTTAIMNATILKDTSILKILLSIAGPDLLRARDAEGNSALNWSVLADNKEAVALLLATDAYDTNDRSDALHLANRIGHSDLRDVLLS